MRSMFAVVTAFVLSISSAQARALVRLQNVRGATSFSVVGCDVPSGSALGKTLIERAGFGTAHHCAARSGRH
jgi:hypothetical protein